MQRYLRQILIGALLASSGVRAQSAKPEDALAFEQQQKWPEAVQVWKAVTARNPNDAAAFAALGVDFSRLQKYDEAAAAYRKALRLNPRLPGIRFNLGLAEFKQRHFPPASAAFLAVLAADPSNGQARTLLGMSYYAEKKFDLAAQQLETASKGDPENAELHQMLAESCFVGQEAGLCEGGISAIAVAKSGIGAHARSHGTTLEDSGNKGSYRRISRRLRRFPQRAQRSFRPRLSVLEVTTV